MRHITNLKINHFRGIKNLELLELGEINIFVGRNNCGKTSVLEAIELLENPTELMQYIGVARLRDPLPRMLRGRLSTIDSLKWLFPQHLGDKDKKQQIDLAFTLRDRNYTLHTTAEQHIVVKPVTPVEDDAAWADDVMLEEMLEDTVEVLEVDIELVKDDVAQTQHVTFEEGTGIRWPRNENELVNIHFVTPIDHRVRQLSSKSIHDIIVSGDRPKIIDALKLFDPDIEGLELLAPDGISSVPYLHHKTLGLAPLIVFGDGLRKAVTLAAAIIKAEDGILLIDELETAVHTKALSELFSWMVKACKQFRVQLFATTHSLEALDAVLEASEDSLSRLVAYRLTKQEENTVANRFSGKTLYNLRYDLGQDVRY